MVFEYGRFSCHPGHGSQVAAIGKYISRFGARLNWEQRFGYVRMVTADTRTHFGPTQAETEFWRWCGRLMDIHRLRACQDC